MANARKTVLYTGVTGDLIKRIYEHKNRLAGGFTSRYNVGELVYYELFDNIENAIQREKQIKNLVRRKKDKLVSSFNPNWEDLYNGILSSA